MGSHGEQLFVRWYARWSTWSDEAHERLRVEKGATAVEYALMVALIALVVIGAVTVLGIATSTKFDSVGSAVNGA